MTIKSKSSMKDSDSIAIWDEDILYNELLDECEKLAISGIPSADKKGHGVMMQFQVRSSFLQVIENIVDKMPKGLYKAKNRSYNRSEICRSMMSIGAYVMAVLYERDSVDMKSITKILTTLNRLASYHKIQQLNDDNDQLEHDIGILKMVNGTEKARKMQKVQESKKELADKLTDKLL